MTITISPCLVTPKSFLFTPNFVVLRKISFKRMIKIKIFPPKMYFAPQTLKPVYGLGSGTDQAMSFQITAAGTAPSINYRTEKDTV